jgi:YVTN family beta-propeller protein
MSCGWLRGAICLHHQFHDNTVSVIDIVNGKVVINTIPVGSNPYGIAVNPASTYAYVTNSGSNPGTVSVIDLTQKVVTAVIPASGGPSGGAVSPSGASVYVSGNLNKTLSVIDTTTTRSRRQ